MLLTVLAIAVTSCSKVDRIQKAKDNTFTVIESSKTAPTIIQQVGIDGRLVIYDLKYEGRTYIIAESPSGLTITEHEPKVKQTVNMDSVVTNSKWIPEYTMLGYTQAQPTKQSLESYYNPEKRPMPIGS